MRFENGTGGKNSWEVQEREIERLDLAYVYNAGFAEETLTPADALSLLPESSPARIRGYSAPRGRQPDYLYDLHNHAEPPIKDAALEGRLFYTYNFLKWRAASLRDEFRANPRHPEAVELTARIWQHVDVAAKIEDYLFRANIGLLVKEARESPERYSDGAIGLLKAIRNFDPERGNRFSTVAVHYMRHAMWRGWRVEQRARENSLAALPDDVISSGLSHEAVVEELERQELLSFLLEELMQAAKLSRRERDMLELRYGINLLYGEELKEIAHKYGLTSSRIGQILAEALQKMKKAAELRPIRRDNL